MEKQPIKVLIVDDEQRSRNVMERYLTEYCPQVKIVGTAGDVQQAAQAIHQLQPQLVFLDIEMPGGNGFQLFKHFPSPQFITIFVTAYQEYAIQAFRSSAVDYLLKPVQISELIQAVNKATELHYLRDHTQRVETLHHNLNPDHITQRLALPVSEGYLFVSIQDIIFLAANGSYTNIYLTNKKPILISKKLYQLNEMIQHPHLFKPHRSYLINLNHVAQYVKKDGGYIVMNNDMNVPLVTTKKEQFMDAIKKHL